MRVVGAGTNAWRDAADFNIERLPLVHVGR